MNIENKIEAILFFRGEPTSISYLSRVLDVDKEQIEFAISGLSVSLNNRGLIIIKNEDKVTLGTNPQASLVIESIVKEELSKEIGKAGTETLSIIMYRAPVTKADIDYIRGVNSHFILRNLSIKGLIEKVHNPNDARSFLYKPSFALLQHLGIAKIEELPEYKEYRNEMIQFMNDNKENTL